MTRTDKFSRARIVAPGSLRSPTGNLRAMANDLGTTAVNSCGDWLGANSIHMGDSRSFDLFDI